jgi:hypothetical protein
MSEQFIAYPGDRPPMLVSAPTDTRGLVWAYVDATPANVQKALEHHDECWDDYEKDPRLVALSNQESSP